MLNREDIERYCTGWQLVAEIEAQERNKMTIQQRLKHLNFLFQSAVVMGIYRKAVSQNQVDAEIVRQRWVQLKAKLT
jgi:cellulose synthase/poly-beta-1,6-N-acetylglucosamine synthase-like glycosyltransferase